MRLALGLLGHPTAHSLSPRLQQACAASVGVEVDYALFDVAPADLAAWLAGPARRLDGFNVTAPYKSIVRAHVSGVGPVAARIGAVNTVARGADGWVGYNTDLAGFTRLLGDGPPGEALVLGAGGAARAAVAGLADRGFGVTVAARDPGRAAAMLAEVGVSGRAVELAEAPAAVPRSAVVVDAVGTPGQAWVLSLPWERLAAGARVLCLAYGAAAAPVVAAVQAAGGSAEDGRRMLAWQGIEAFHHWTGRWPDPAAALASLDLPSREV